jgi:hypothetical protein
MAKPGTTVLCAAESASIEARYRPPQPLAGAPFASGPQRDASTRGEETFASGNGSLMLT